MAHTVEQAPAGDLALLEDPVAQELLHSTRMARVAYTWMDGSPRVIPVWFHWDGSAIVLGTQPDAPKVAALVADPRVAVTIDGETWPYHVLLVRGTAELQQLDDVSPDYVAAAERYFGPERGAAWAEQMRGHPMARIAIQPRWVSIIDFERRLPSAMSG